VRASHVVATDDTIMPMLSKGKTANARMWVYVGDDDHPYNVFDFTLNRGRDGPKYFLKDYNQVLLADAYGGYNGVVAGNEITRAGCWAHMKTKSHRCGEGRSRDRAGSGIERVRALYAVEKQAAKMLPVKRSSICVSSSRRRCWPNCATASCLERAVAAQASHGRSGELCPGPVAGTERLLLRWRGAHRQQRQRAGDEARRSQSQELLFVGNPRGGRTAAILASLTSTCRRHDIDPQLIPAP
jgi:transposase